VPRPDFDIRAGSLPKLLRPALAAFPAHVGYLKADGMAVERWKTRLGELAGEIRAPLRIGVSWRGGTAQTRAALRSLALDDLVPLFAVPEAQFVSLQFDADAAEVAAFRERSGVDLVHFPEAIADYDQTAALVKSLDLVVSVCTAVIHLAGALGVTAWVMAPSVPEWRYGLRGETMPWYPQHRILRQQLGGDWAGVIVRVAGELRELQAARARHP
jgi:hypothetical protein